MGKISKISHSANFQGAEVRKTDFCGGQQGKEGKYQEEKMPFLTLSANTHEPTTYKNCSLVRKCSCRSWWLEGEYQIKHNVLGVSTANTMMAL